MESFGNRIKRLRKKKNLVQAEMAAILGIDRGHLSNLEQDNAQPSFKVLGRIADVLDVSLDYLYHGETAALAESSVGPRQDLEEIKLLKIWRKIKKKDRIIVALLLEKFSKDESE